MLSHLYVLFFKSTSVMAPFMVVLLGQSRFSDVELRKKNLQAMGKVSVSRDTCITTHFHTFTHFALVHISQGPIYVCVARAEQVFRCST